jgi:hypothetical protein
MNPGVAVSKSAIQTGHNLLMRSSMTYQLKKSAYLSVQMDGLSSGGRHLAALCISVPEEQFFANAYENWREDAAANSAVAVNACLSDLLEVSSGARRPLPQGKVAGVT